jgi:hypothetical protein
VLYLLDLLAGTDARNAGLIRRCRVLDRSGSDLNELGRADTPHAGLILSGRVLDRSTGLCLCGCAQNRSGTDLSLYHNRLDQQTTKRVVTEEVIFGYEHCRKLDVRYAALNLGGRSLNARLADLGFDRSSGWRLNAGDIGLMFGAVDLDSRYLSEIRTQFLGPGNEIGQERLCY